jgi:hypothetical protein
VLSNGTLKPFSYHSGSQGREIGLPAAQVRFDPCNRSALHGAFLRELQEKHERLFAAIATLETLTRQSEADWPTFCEARWRTSEASLARRTLAGRIIDHLLSSAEERECVALKALKSLKASDQDMLQFSARHVRRWPLSAIQNDWKAYCRDSRLVRARMVKFLREEEQILFPMLEASAGARFPERRDLRVRLVR